ncbi:MAG: Gfo/Idh/MocA family oxidoreductase [Clostridia bacterium]|nr:Gfo/Idh/MocA family oxidoreductase [Clostridia bacterium]
MGIKKVKTAVIGCGMISSIYLRNLCRMFSVIDLAAVGNIHKEAAQARAKEFGIPKAMSIEEAAADPEIELAVNLTPAFAHYDVIKRMLKAGKHVYTEKMFTTDLNQSRELVALAAEKGLFLGVAPDTVLGAGIQTAKYLIDTGMIGDVTSVQVCINRNQALNSEFFRFLRGPGGTLPYDVGVYYVGALIALLGSVTQITAFGNPAPLHEPQAAFLNEGAEPWQIPGLNTVAASLRFACGAVGSVLFDGNTVGAEQHGFTVYGTRGILKVGDPDKFGDPVTLILPENAPVQVPFTHGFDGKNYLGEPASFDNYGHRGIGVAEMAWALRRGRPHARLSGEYGLHCQEVLQGMEISAETGKVYEPQSRFEMKGLKPGYYSSMFGGAMRGDAEASLMD